MKGGDLLHKKLKLGWVFILVLTLSLFTAGSAMVPPIPNNEVVNTPNIKTNMLIPGGIPIGIYMDTNGVMVIDTESIEGSNGKLYYPSTDKIKSGDYIIGINSVEIDTKGQLISEVKNLTDKKVVLSIRRDDKVFQINITPVKDKSGEYKLGIWVRDNLQGLGTLTYIDTTSNFGALGHGIHDIDTNKLLQINSGELFQASINSVIKGTKGSPGGLEGVIVYNPSNRIGTISGNSEAGIYGQVYDISNLEIDTKPLEIATVNQIKTGAATIRCTIKNKVEEYEIQILNVNKNESEVNKGLVIQVTDPKLIAMTGGIVQGMSGSPIIQEDRIVGAVTHVFVNDPTRGYGIFIENMLATSKKIAN